MGNTEGAVSISDIQCCFCVLYKQFTEGEATNWNAGQSH